MDAKHYAWVYLLEHGQPGTPSYYGGTDYPDEWVSRFARKGSWDQFTPILNGLLKDIRNIGVDWSRTQEPRSDLVTRFTDTFHDPETEECLMGTLVLLDGSKQAWYAESVAITNVFSMLAIGDAFKEKFDEYFRRLK